MSGQSESFDQVIVAVQANTALRLLPDGSPTERRMTERRMTERRMTERMMTERRILSAIHYENTEITVHHDASLMPPNARDWSTFNMLTKHDDVKDLDCQAACTVWMNRFHRWDTKQNVFQTIVPQAESPWQTRLIDSNKVIDRVALQRPVVTQESAGAVAELTSLQQQSGRRILFAGSWAVEGVPLLETGVVSAGRCVAAVDRNYAEQPQGQL